MKRRNRRRCPLRQSSINSLFASLLTALMPKEVLIRTVTDWTEDRIIQEIEAVFPDGPIMVDVARCEGSRDGVIQAVIEGPTGDVGLFKFTCRHMASGSSSSASMS